MLDVLSKEESMSNLYGFLSSRVADDDVRERYGLSRFCSTDNFLAAIMSNVNVDQVTCFINVFNS